MSTCPSAPNPTPGSGQSLLKRVFASPSFLVAAGLLLVAAIGWNGAIYGLSIVFAKEYVALKSPLDQLPERFGSRFELANHGEFKDAKDGKLKMTSDMEEVLGTKEYITWLYRDTSRPDHDTFVRLHLAYYSGLLDAVPHVPDVCMVAGGAQAAGSREVVWSLSGLPQAWRDWRQTRLCRSTFAQRAKDGLETRSVAYYVFSVNGEPMWDRLAVRGRLMDPRKKYCYFMKIELSAFDGREQLTDEQSDEICRAFLAASLPDILRHVASADEINQMEASRRR